MKRFRKVYLEISNICNLSCAFCPGTKRSPRVMSLQEFSALLPKVRPYTDYLYFHLMGEPLCHPELEHFLTLCAEEKLRVIITTNGTLVSKKASILQNAPALHKVNISLHAFEANDLSIPFETYLEQCFDFGKQIEGNAIICYRLWNQGGSDSKNEEIIETMRRFFPGNWVQEPRGTRIADRVYLEYGDKFDWPGLDATDFGDNVFCYGLRDQIGILCDGTVVPCCLDHDGDIALGNLFHDTLDEILAGSRAKAIYEGFSNSHASEELCRRCGYARRFRK